MLAAVTLALTSAASGMLGELASLDVLILLIGVPVALGLMIWAIVDAAMRPGYAFDAAHRSKPMWIALVAAGSFLCWPIGVVLSIAYLTSIRGSVREAQRTVAPPAGYASRPVGYGPPPAGYGPPPAGYAPPPGYAPPASGVAPSAAGTPPPGWYPDPRQPGREWFWDGSRYTTSRDTGAPPV